MKIYLENVYNVDRHRFIACQKCTVRYYQFTELELEAFDGNFGEYAVITGLKDHTYECPNDCEDECPCEIQCEGCGRILTGEAN